MAWAKIKDTRWKEKVHSGTEQLMWIEVGMYRGIQNEAAGTSQTWNSNCKEVGSMGPSLAAFLPSGSHWGVLSGHCPLFQDEGLGKDGGAQPLQHTGLVKALSWP